MKNFYYALQPTAANCISIISVLALRLTSQTGKKV